MDITCRHCRKLFVVSDSDRAFHERISPTFAGKTYTVPPPTHCPDCRQQRRLAQCNERYFFSASCSLCKKRLLTEQPPQNKKTVYCPECWHGDQWDPCDYGRDVDFSRPIFAQLKELWQEVPAQNLMIEGTNVNSEYIHYAGFAKNCYLIMHADYCEDCCYGYGFKHNRSCMDGFYNLGSELLYDCVDCHKCYGLTSSQDCVNCHSSAFLRDCVGCKNCFLCVGLREKEYCFENVQLSKEDYIQKMASIDLQSHRQFQACKKRRRELELLHPYKEFQGHNVEQSSGDHLSNCKNVQDSFDCEDVEDARYCYQVVTGAKNVQDVYQYGLKLQESYECAIAGNNGYHLLFCHNAHINCSDLFYCWFIQSSQHCFGCVNVHHKKYCIFNKQYTKEEYEMLVPKIIEHMKKTEEWGEFFPMSFSPFGYNKTTAQLYYPRVKDEALQESAQWDEYEAPPAKALKTIPADALPDRSADVPDDILNWAIVCEETGKPFRIVKQELQFYRQQKLPIPRRSPDQRHLDRFLLRNPRQFWDRQCGKCAKDIRTTYAPGRPEIVYCEECYLKTIY